MDETVNQVIEATEKTFTQEEVNQIVGDLFSGNAEYAQTALKELIGHTPLQVVMGALLGTVIGLFFPAFGPIFAV